MKIRSRNILAGLALALFSLRVSVAYGQYGTTNALLTNDFPLADGDFTVSYEAPPLPEVAIPRSPTPSPYRVFNGQTDDGFYNVPDANGAVNENFVMTMTSRYTTITDRSGAYMYVSNFTSNWWSALIPNITWMSDVAMVYDPFSQRWIAAANQEPYPGKATTPYVMIAVSQTSNPTNGWYGFEFPPGPGGTNVADYLNLGFNKDKIVLTFNSLSSSTYEGHGVGMLIFNKTNLYAGLTNFYVGSTNLTNGGTNFQFIYQPQERNLGWSIVPCITYDTTNSDMWMIATYGAGSGTLQVSKITGAVGSSTFARLAGHPAGASWEPSAGVSTNTPEGTNVGPQLGTTVRIYESGCNMMQATYRNGYIWCAHPIYLNLGYASGRCSILWWQIDPYKLDAYEDPAVAQYGKIDDPTGVTNYSFPSLAVNQFNDVMIGYSRFSSNQYASGNYTIRSGSDSPTVTDGDYMFQAGVSPYWFVLTNNADTNAYKGDVRNRWGDYSRTMVDPVNDIDFWTIQEYAGQYVGTYANYSGRWGVAWAQVLMTPTNDMVSNAIAITGANGSIQVDNARATVETGEPTTVGGYTGGASLWYSWTAPTTSIMWWLTIESSFQSLIGVYTGTSVSNLTFVGNGVYPGELGSNTCASSFYANAGTTYYISIEGSNGMSGTAYLNWIQEPGPPPTFWQQPQSANVLAGSSVTFTATAVSDVFAYQWMFNGTNISGATNSSYTIGSVTTNETGSYSVSATNDFGSTNSQGAWLQVYPTATPLLSACNISNNQVLFQVSGITNSTYIVQTTTNLVTPTSWANVYTGLVTYIYVDPSSITNTNNAQRFYRAVWAP